MLEQKITLLAEGRVINPPASFIENANFKNLQIYQNVEEDFEGFWEKQAQRLDWYQEWDRVLEWQVPYAKWFQNGKLNASYNCLDRHLKTDRKNKAALIWEGEPGDTRVFTYQQLYYEVTRFANVLKSLGVKKGDVVTIYLPMIPELSIAMLACTRIGAPHNVVFGGYSVEALNTRVEDARSRIIITADGGFRRGNIVPLKANTDAALEINSNVEKVIVVQRAGEAINCNMIEGRDFWWHDLMEKAEMHCPPEVMDAEDPLFVLYTSGSTGKPKGVVHTTGGYLTGVSATFNMVFDIKENDIYFCTADLGWITGHSYSLYAPFTNGVTSIMYEGSPDYPEKDRFWKMVEKYAVTIFYTAPTAVRAFMSWGERWPEGRDLSTLRLLGIAGEPINPAAWLWYYKYIGNENCPIVDTWWQTETGMIMITSLPGLIPMKPGSATLPLPGLEVDIYSEQGDPLPEGQQGHLVIKKPWPSMLKTVFGDEARYVDSYWSRFPSAYYTGDMAYKDHNGYIWVVGRADDVINVSGHCVGSAEVESSLVEHSAVAEAAIIGIPHEIKGQTIVAFISLREGFTEGENLSADLKAYVSQRIGAFARPEKVIFTHELPKTRSGKIIRRLLKNIAEGKALGDISTIANPDILEDLRSKFVI